MLFSNIFLLYKFCYQFNMAETSVEITLYIQFLIIRNVINNSQWRRRVWKSPYTYNFILYLMLYTIQDGGHECGNLFIHAIFNYT